MRLIKPELYMWYTLPIVMILFWFPALSAGPSWAVPGAHPIGCATVGFGAGVCWGFRDIGAHEAGTSGLCVAELQCLSIPQGQIRD